MNAAEGLVIQALSYIGPEVVYIFGSEGILKRSNMMSLEFLHFVTAIPHPNIGINTPCQSLRLLLVFSPSFYTKRAENLSGRHT